MKILVGLKRAIDYNVRIRVKSDGAGVESDGVKMSINPFDEIALEQALRLKEAGHAEEIVIVSVGTKDSEQQLRTGLAMGADRGILVVTDDSPRPLSIAKTMLKIARRESVGLVILGKQSIDSDNNQTGQMLAALWDRPQATFASAVELRESTARVTREVDAGEEVIEVDLPAVVTVDLRLNEPRYVKLPDIMKAKKKPIETMTVDELGVPTSSNLKVTNYSTPLQRNKGIMVNSTSELVAAIKDRGLL